MARKHGLDKWIDDAIKDTSNPNCNPTEKECEMLARMVNDERVQRTDIPPILGKSYRECIDDDDFEHIKKLKRVGIYSKVDAMVYKAKNVKKR